MARKIFLFLPTLEGGGAERVVTNLANQFASRGLDCRLILADAVGPYLEQLSRSVQVVDLGGHSVSRSLLPLAAYLRKYEPELLISALEHANIVAIAAGLLAGRRTRVVVTVHENYSWVFKNVHAPKERLVRVMARLLYPRAHKVVAVSKGAGADVQRILGLASERMAVLYNPVVDDRMFAKAKEPCGHPWLQGTDCPVVVAAGSLIPLKDFRTLIEAVRIACKKTPLKLIIAGEGPERPALERQIESSGLADFVSLAGFLPNPYSLMARASVFVLSSRTEALPTVLIEALALGVPVVSTDCEHGPGEILDNGRYGRLVPVGDAERLAGAIIDAVQNPGPLRPDAAWRRFGIEAVADDYLRLANNLDTAHSEPTP